MIQEMVQNGLSINLEACRMVDDVRSCSHRGTVSLPSSEGEPSERPYLVTLRNRPRGFGR